MSTARHAFDMMLARFGKRVPLSKDARAALLGLPYELKTYPKHSYLVREGERATTAKLIVVGLAYRHKITADGARQILSLHIAGDFVDLEGSLLSVADHNVQVLTTCTIAEVPRAAVVELVDRHGAVAHAMWIDSLIDASVYREWVVNVGRRNSRQAMCHLLCEFGRRLEFAGLAKGGRYELPMTQEQLADCLGVTAVHVNRVLKELDRDGLVLRRERFVEVPDRVRLSKVTRFSDQYLHLDQLVAPNGQAHRVAKGPASNRTTAIPDEKLTRTASSCFQNADQPAL